MWEAIASLFKEAKDRLNSPLYWAFILSFVVWNWDVFVTLFLTDNDSILALTDGRYIKAGYIRDVLIWNHDVATIWFGETYVNFGYFLFSCLRLFVPIGLTYLFVTQIPRLTNWAYVEDRKFLNERRLKNVESERDFEVGRLKILEQTVGATEKAKKAVKQVEQNVQIINAVPQLSKERIQQNEWNNEFEKLISKYPKIVQQLEELIYQHSWHVMTGFDDRLITIEAERVLDSSSLIQKDDKNNRYVLTEKGKSFLKANTI